MDQRGPPEPEGPHPDAATRTAWAARRGGVCLCPAPTEVLLGFISSIVVPHNNLFRENLLWLKKKSVKTSGLGQGLVHDGPRAQCALHTCFVWHRILRYLELTFLKKSGF